jgi:Sec-independent protein translocase protein TatA
MDKIKISLVALFVLIGAALVFVFSNKKKTENIHDKMAAVRAAKQAKRYVEQEQEQEKPLENEKIQDSAN